MIYNKFIICSTTEAFESKLAAGDIVSQHIVFIEETSRIWTNGKMYGGADVSELPSAGPAGSGQAGLVIVGDNITISNGTISISKTNVENALGFVPVDAEASNGTIASNGKVMQLTQAGLPIYPVTTADCIFNSDGSTTSLGDQISSLDSQITNINSSLANKVSEAPKDSKAYLRNNGSWTELNSKLLSDLGIDIGNGSAEQNVQADWAETDTSSDAYIKNKPKTLADLGIADIYNPRERGSNTHSSLANLPVNKALVIVNNYSSASTISLASNMNVGESITVVCTPSASFTQPLPTTGAWTSMDGDSLSVKAGSKFEINILCIASGSYSISCKVAV